MGSPECLRNPLVLVVIGNDLIGNHSNDFALKRLRWLNLWERPQIPQGYSLAQKTLRLFPRVGTQLSQGRSHMISSILERIILQTTKTVPLATKQKQLLQYDDK